MMQDLFGSVRRSIVFRPNPSGDITEKIGSCLRKSRVGLGLGLGFPPKLPSPPPPSTAVSDHPPIRWRKGELIGCGAFGHVYMGMNLDSGELLAVKQVLIGKTNASKEKAQAHIKELEEEVKLLQNLSHPNIVRYLGTAREEDTLNILLEFVPGGSISSLLGKFGSFPEAVIRMYTKQLLQGLEYLHCNKIMHRDIKGANILVDNKGCIKLADFGASKQVAKLATITAAKSMKGTPYWMAPEVIVQSGHSFPADIWSVGCTVIEMATGKPPWSQQYQEVAALFHVGTTKSHPPIPEHLSSEAKDFLLKCLQQEPYSRPTAADLLQHPFVIGRCNDSHPLCGSSIVEPSASSLPTSKSIKNTPSAALGVFNNVEYDSRSCSTMYHNRMFRCRPLWEMSTNDEDMVRLDAEDDFSVVGQSFNPVSEPFDDWPSKFDISPEQRGMGSQDFGNSCSGAGNTEKQENDFTFPSEPMVEDDDEVTDAKIRAFLDEKALDLKKLQTPLYEEFYNTINATTSPVIGNICKESLINTGKLPPKSKPSPSNAANGLSLAHVETVNNMSPVNPSSRVLSSCLEDSRVASEVLPPRVNEWGELLQGPQKELECPSASFSERRRKWKEELDQELAREREMMRLAGAGGRTSSPKDNRKRDHLRYNSPAK